MGGARIKIFAAVFALLVLCGAVGAAFYVWEKVFKPEIRQTKDLRAEMASKAPKADPGKPVYWEAVEHVKKEEFGLAREKLTQMVRIYADSPLAGDAKRILGEMNVDRLFSKQPGPGKLEFTVNREPGLEIIAKKSRCTVPFLRKINGLGRAIIHPGDHLIVQPLDFEAEVNQSSKKLILKQKGEFFKQYDVSVVQAEGTSYPKETYIESKQGILQDKPVRDYDNRWPQARKWLQTKGSASRPGVIFCAPPKKAGDAGGFGIHLSPADIDELCTILRAGTPVFFRKS
jgi:hypothetical protein